MLIQKLQEDLKQAQLSREETRVLTLRLLLSEIKNTEISKGVELTDPEVVSVIQKEAKKRRESIESFNKGGREDLVVKEEAELTILQAYLPEQMPNEELTKIIEETINEVGASSPADMGKVMSNVMNKVVGRAEGRVVSQLVKERLS